MNLENTKTMTNSDERDFEVSYEKIDVAEDYGTNYCNIEIKNAWKSFCPGA